MTEHTLVIIKPDGVERGLVDEIVSRIEGAGLSVVEKRREPLDRAKLEKIYSAHLEKDYFEEHAAVLLSGDSVVMLVEGNGAIARMRQLIGATDPAKAEKGTIRGDLAPDVYHNVIHAADSPESFEREAQLFFPKQ